MSERIHALANQLLGRPSVRECTLDEVRSLVSKYPYFAAAQFLLLEKLKQEGLPEYTDQLQKAVLYYHDPVEFEYLIASNRFLTEYEVDEALPSVEVITESATPEVQSSGIEVTPEVPVQQEIQAEPEKEYEPEPTSVPVIDTESQPEPISQNEEPYKTPAPPPTHIVFEPYHTVDYFASQGIKLTQEELPKDKFGKQLKSFTEWLKTMKRLPPKDLVQSLDSTSESKVQHLAAHSVDETEVTTESMAEVWLKQGNKEKALEVYNKLSLLNPSKKAYFAAKIENLKYL